MNVLRRRLLHSLSRLSRRVDRSDAWLEAVDGPGTRVATVDDVDADPWALVGRDLMQYHLDVTAGELHGAFRAISKKVGDPNQEITGDDVNRLLDALEEAEETVEQLGAVPEGYVPPPRVRDLLTVDELKEVVERSPRITERP